MPRWYWKLFVYGIILCFCIMFGVDLASRGMNRIEGPGGGSGGAARTGGSGGPATSGSLPEETFIRTGGGRSGGQQPGVTSQAQGTGASAPSPAAGPDAAAGNAGSARTAESANRPAETPAPPKPTPRPLGTGDPLEAGSMNHLGNKLGDLLQITAQSGMDGVVSMFEWVVK
ncbi:hypothetical protein PC41400_23425 [Paenibacillus chitinolyticus]|uniref:Uncharacterized protein n=1 Tax=Paenibacillus chitinolyticus TaxID=79263 RepID=A0A410X1H9_9BACL|nr:hypothetical protein [Paenibacillus chitinolyticus]MCY9592546.1 hypothetical protein [Paenibacillus chitinolyticus]MCY9594851.1 hypothetical protein [Paenibacillus chitinolyticus]QAV20465.1 hypothetical protein PC41400_23425 [Paenibacillus chitinolyticus]